MSLTPEVSGVSPKEGPPGTLITIRGDNLGVDASDVVSVKVCGVECVLTINWSTSRKITARSGFGEGVGEIIIVTGTGGTGTCSVTFRGYKPTAVGPLQETAVFIDETHSFLTAWDKHRLTTDDLIETDDLLGLASELSNKQARFNASRLQEIFPDNSGDISLPNFSPQWYLLEHHSSASFEDLKSGLAHLQSRDVKHSEEPMAFIKNNLATFMDCQDALVTMHNKLVLDENKGSLNLDKLTMLLQAADKDSSSLFDDIISRKEKSDSHRNILQIINRFKVLFYLPPTLRHNIKTGNYDQVVIDYTRAKLLFHDTEVSVLKRVYDEVTREIEKFKTSLSAQLLQLPANVDEKKRIIRHLVDLEYTGNAAWECISHQYKWLTDLLHTCKEEFTEIERDEIEYGSRNKSQPDSYKPLIFVSDSQQHSRKKLHSDSSTNPKQRTPHRVLFAEDLSHKLTENFPAFFQLAHAYFQGQLLRKDKEESNKGKNERQQLYQTFKLNIIQLLSLYSNLIRRAMLPDSLSTLNQTKQLQLGDWALPKSHLPSAWLPQCVRTVRQTTELIRSELPTDSNQITLLQELVFDLRADAMRTILKQAIDCVSELHNEENWMLETHDSSGSITKLPGLFEKSVTQSVTHLNDVISKVKPGETDIFNDQGTQEQATRLCMEIIKAYIQTLDKCAFDPLIQFSSTAAPAGHINDNIKPSSENTLLRLESVNESLTDRRRIIIVMSNLDYSYKKILPRLIEMLDSHGYQETEKVMEYAGEAFDTLQDKIYHQYTDTSVTPIIADMEDDMYRGNYDWSLSKEPTTVKEYVKNAITGLLAIHNEMFSILPDEYTPILLSSCVSEVGLELSRLLTTIPQFSKHSAIQARVDLMAYLHTTERLIKYTPAHNELLSTLDKITRTSKQSKSVVRDEQKMEKLFEEFKWQFKFHLLAFRTVSALPMSELRTLSGKKLRVDDERTGSVVNV